MSYMKPPIYKWIFLIPAMRLCWHGEQTEAGLTSMTKSLLCNILALTEHTVSEHYTVHTSLAS